MINKLFFKLIIVYKALRESSSLSVCTTRWWSPLEGGEGRPQHLFLGYVGVKMAGQAIPRAEVLCSVNRDMPK